MQGERRGEGEKDGGGGRDEEGKYFLNWYGKLPEVALNVSHCELRLECLVNILTIY